ncbi:MAG: hypothetical protein RIG61_12250 [Deltaproteobacteria bacterium]
MFPLTGGEKNVRLRSEADIGSLRFHGIIDMHLARKQYPVSTIAHVPTTGIQYKKRRGSHRATIIHIKKAMRICTGNAVISPSLILKCTT